MSITYNQTIFVYILDANAYQFSIVPTIPSQNYLVGSKALVVAFSSFIPKYPDLLTSDVAYSLSVGSSSSLPTYVALNGQMI